MSDKLKPTVGTPSPALAEKAPKRELPRVTFSEDDIPEIKDWKVGEKHFIEIQADVETVSKDRFGTGDQKNPPLTATLKVIAVEAIPDAEEKKEQDGLQEKLPKNFKGNPNRL